MFICAATDSAAVPLNCIRMISYEVEVRDLDPFFVSGNPEYEQYALVYSKQMAELFKEDESKEEMNLDRFVKIISCDDKKRKVYRKCSARKGTSSNEVAIGSRTQKELGCKKGSMVEICKASWTQYYWHNSDSSIKFAFILAVIGAVCGIASFLLEILCKLEPFFQG